MNQSLTQQNTISAEVVLDCFDSSERPSLHGSHGAAENLMEDYNVSGNRKGH